MLLQLIQRQTVHGAIAPDEDTLVPMEMKDWGMQLPFLLINFGMAGLLGAAFNSMRMWLWKLRAAKTLHVQRILEVIGLVFLVGLCGFFFAWAAGKCIELPANWYEGYDASELRQDEGDGGPPTNHTGSGDTSKEREYGVRFFCKENEHNDIATLFLSSTHHTIIKLFSISKTDKVCACIGAGAGCCACQNLSVDAVLFAEEQAVVKLHASLQVNTMPACPGHIVA